MSNSLINFYHNLEEPIIVYDKKQNVLYHNLAFKKMFGDFNSQTGFNCLNKLSYKFSYQMCFLKSGISQHPYYNLLLKYYMLLGDMDQSY